MGIRPAESDRIEPVSIHIPNRQKAPPVRPRKKSTRQPGWFFRGVLQAMNFIVLLAIIATVTLFGGAAWMSWQESIRQEQFFRNDPFFNGRPLPTREQKQVNRDAQAFWNYRLDDQRSQSDGGER